MWLDMKGFVVYPHTCGLGRNDDVSYTEANHFCTENAPSLSRLRTFIPPSGRGALLFHRFDVFHRSTTWKGKSPCPGSQYTRGRHADCCADHFPCNPVYHYEVGIPSAVLKKGATIPLKAYPVKGEAYHLSVISAHC
jgi:hypothetical protein